MKNLKNIIMVASFCLVSINALATKDHTSIKVTNTVAWISSRLSDMVVEMCAGQEGGFESDCVQSLIGPVRSLQSYESLRIGHQQPAYSLELDLFPKQVRRDVLALIETYNQFKTNSGGTLEKSQTVKSVFINFMNGTTLSQRQLKKLRKDF